MTKFIVSFYSDLESLAIKRTNSAIAKVLSHLDWVHLDIEEKTKLRKVIIDEVNEMKRDFLEYFRNVSNGKED